MPCTQGRSQWFDSTPEGQQMEQLRQANAALSKQVRELQAGNERFVRDSLRYVEAQPDSGPHKPAMPAHWIIENERLLERDHIACGAALANAVEQRDAAREQVRQRDEVIERVRAWAAEQAGPFPDGTPDREGESVAEGVLAALDGPR